MDDTFVNTIEVVRKLKDYDTADSVKNKHCSKASSNLYGMPCLCNFNCAGCKLVYK